MIFFENCCNFAADFMVRGLHLEREAGEIPAQYPLL